MPLAFTALAIAFTSWFLLSRFHDFRPIAMKIVVGQWALLCGAVCFQWLVSARAPARDRAPLRAAWRLLAWLLLAPVACMDLAALALFAADQFGQSRGAQTAGVVFIVVGFASFPVGLVAIIAWFIGWATVVDARSLTLPGSRWALAVAGALAVWAGSVVCAFMMVGLLTVNV